ncbi:bS18 family ribosomal protein [Candidatus Deianiraea vastatrix]|uniref:30S ribosomal protein S18 n=1 Tax=Candidatus Deianiraea vastatrix TaxID=2163644 RepID=A0A5B8XDW4_9RICK|nr:ribosomal protein S18 [Candidatus Deianiraea vastatrix]QED23420.1 30S ribosomal protein S18 [Candidatus Deianiraea vastatrix]
MSRQITNNIKNRSGSNVPQVFEGMSNTAINVSSVVPFSSVFSGQNRRFANISTSLIHYHNYFILKQILTDMSRKIMRRDLSGLSRSSQRELRKHVFIARFLGLLPYVK